MQIFTMKKVTFVLLAAILGKAALYGQSADDQGIGLRFVYDRPLDRFEMKWWAKSGVFYFVQQTNDLREPWSYFPYAVAGEDDVEGFFIQRPLDEASMFFRVKYTDDLNSSLMTEDFDGDGISNGDELTTWGHVEVFDAATIVDTDGDGMADYWEIFYFGGLGRDGTGDFDNDGILDKFEWQMRSNPASNDSSLAALRDEFSYDNRGWLAAYRLAVSKSRSYSADAEGNLNQHN